MSVSKFADPGADSPGFVLWKLTQRWQRAVADALEPLGVTQTQFVILACAYWLTQKTESIIFLMLYLRFINWVEKVLKERKIN